ncbi:hypothetical protein QQF64_028898 [Cirrhinus molitorella]|uniref:ribonuclease H n=1 Tax=Cirrhinus molitorella TaxID=172907 RepID=A0ABR3N8F2_9TELE
MLKLGVIEPSRSPWSSPIVMVPKPDGTLRFCNDFLNEVSDFDGYPMPRMDKLLERGHWQYRTLPFGLHGAPATFQRLMDILLHPHQAYAAAYLDDIVIHSETWEDHLTCLRRVLMELRRAGLTANPRKCHLALSEVKYQGFTVGGGLVRPQPAKVEAVRDAPGPLTKSQVQTFFGLAEKEGAAREDCLDQRDRRGVPPDQGGPHLGTPAEGSGFQLPFPGTDRCLRHMVGSRPVPNTGRLGTPCGLQ